MPVEGIRGTDDGMPIVPEPQGPDLSEATARSVKGSTADPTYVVGQSLVDNPVDQEPGDTPSLSGDNLRAAIRKHPKFFDRVEDGVLSNFRRGASIRPPVYFLLPTDQPNQVMIVEYCGSSSDFSRRPSGLEEGLGGDYNSVFFRRREITISDKGLCFTDSPDVFGANLEHLMALHSTPVDTAKFAAVLENNRGILTSDPGDISDDWVDAIDGFKDQLENNQSAMMGIIQLIRNFSALEVNL